MGSSAGLVPSTGTNSPNSAHPLDRSDEQAVNCVSVSFDGRPELRVPGFWSRVLPAWGTYRRARKFPGLKGIDCVSSPQLLLATTCVITALEDKTVWKWDVATGQETRRF